MAAALNGAAAMACGAIGVFFLRFWSTSRERLFAALAVGFSALAANYTMLGLLPLADERRGYAFGIRSLAFLVILVGVLHERRDLADRFAARDRFD
jgi:hypothetical protein